MKKVIIFMLILILFNTVISCTSGSETQLKTYKFPQERDDLDKEAVINLVKEFGGKLKSVSLLAPKDILEKNMMESYEGFVTIELLSKWINDPLNAPGRLTSSPWPDRVEITSIEKISKYTYEVKGIIIEITSEDITTGGIAARRAIILRIKKIKDKWLIYYLSLGEYI